MKEDWFFKTIMSILEENPNINLNEEELESLISDVINNTLPENAELVLKSLKDNSVEMLGEQRLLRTEFEARLYRKWFKPITLLETLLVIARESAEGVYEDCYEKAKKDSNFIFDALIKIQARACQITYEILCLIRGGFADGAMSRWRTMHELAVLAFFLTQNDNKVAKMYLEYENIEKYYEMLEYNKHASRLGYDKVSVEDYNYITDIRNKLVEKYGSDYEKPYGWTMDVLPKKERNFKGVEKNIKMDHFRPFYKLACNYIHLGPKASSFSLGVLNKDDFILSGASNYGFADPGQNTSISLSQISTCLLTIYTTYERLVTVKIMYLLVGEICDSFVEVQKEIILEEEELNNDEC